MESLREWLEALGLAGYAAAFAENDVDFEVLDELSDEDLKDLGLSLGHRRRLQKALRERSGAAPGLEPDPLPAATETNAPRPARAEAERRQLTVMFCDLVGSTELSQNLDAEALRDVNRAYQDACKSAIERYEGYVARYMGDGVLAYFGYPQAHEDDPERAIHAGLGVVESMAALQGHGGPDVRVAVRVGIATGPVVVGDLIGEGASQENAVVGETPNLAARLQGLAAPDSVVIGPGTKALAGRRFEYEDLGRHALKGIAAPVHVWRVIAPARVESRFEAARHTELTPLVGRDHEIELLLERWANAKEGDGQVVLLAGEAGIGKSRIVESLHERTALDQPIRLRYQCSPYHASSALHPIIEQLERAAGFRVDDGEEEKLDKLEELLAAGTAEVETAAALLAPLLSIPAAGRRYRSVELSPERRKEQTLETLVTQLEGLSRTRPILFVFEDAHWADPTSLELLSLTVGRIQGLPVLVTITYRPEFEPPWAGYTHVTSLTLNRFTRKLASAIVDNVTGGKTLPAQVLEQIIAKTDGVPLFVEELTKTILESGLLIEQSGGYELAGTLSSVSIPMTLHDSLMARLDRLNSVKEVAQTAAAIGREFDYELLAAVSPLGAGELRAALARLVEAELVFHYGPSRDVRYRFKHALVRDAAYESLLNRTRREIHGRIAAVLESRFPERVDREPELLAHHFTEAGRADEGVRYWREAGRLAAGRSAYAEAAHHFTDGLATLGDGIEDHGRLRIGLDLQVGLADSLVWWKGFSAPEVEAAYLDARALCRRAGDTPELFGVLWGLWHYFDIRGDLGKAYELAHELRGLADASASPGRRSQAHRALGETSLWRGEFTAAKEETERGAAVYLPGPDSLVPGGEDAAVANRALAALGLWCLGYPDRALQRATEALELSSKTGNAGDAGMAQVFLGWVHLLRREPEAARDRAERLLEFSTELGMVFFELFASVHRGAAVVALGDPDGLLAMRSGIESIDAIGAGNVKVGFLTLLAEAHLEAGRPAEALTVVESAIRDLEDSDNRWLSAECYRLQAAALRGLGDEAGCETLLERALGTARQQRARAFELRTATDLARLWRDHGRHGDARELLAPVFDWFTEGLGTPDLLTARALLEDLGRESGSR